ncbi:MAG: AmmeMemoRadiSam system protein B [Betaproteobacteria bacterium]|nr:AmmeMemoRadiSam system protein B [Betaproteobacteria bacterium]
MTSIRPAAVAGAFYPGSAPELAAELGALLRRSEVGEPRLGWPKALIVPHAGYVYSGPVAARAYRELENARGTVRRVVLLGPVHRVPIRGIALPGADAFATPLGRITIDAEASRVVSDLAQVLTHRAAHAYEHSLEVQLPFLQRLLGEFSLVPLAVGTASAQEVAEVIERLWGGPETIIVVSTDLSHYHGYDEARRIDAATISRIAALAADLVHEQACGATPLNGLLLAASRRGLTVRLLAACNSGDTAGDRDRVVGYSAFALDEPAHSPTAEKAGHTLIGIARAAITGRLGAGNGYDIAGAAWLTRPGASFVTLTRDGRLRGCIGSLEAVRPLGEDVAENALGAAFRDPRFPALRIEEWARCALEVSVLSRPEPLSFASEAKLIAQLRPGEDGLIIEHAAGRGTFLPQVWESLPQPRMFLDELKTKAGLRADQDLARCKVSRYRVVKWCEGDFAS